MNRFGSKFSRIATVIAVSLMLIPAAFAGGESLDAATRNKLFAIYHAYTSEHFSDFVVDERIMTPQVEDHGDTWLVTYDLKGGYTGGNPVVYIDKKSMAVIQGYLEQ